MPHHPHPKGVNLDTPLPSTGGNELLVRSWLSHCVIKGVSWSSNQALSDRAANLTMARDRTCNWETAREMCKLRYLNVCTPIPWRVSRLFQENAFSLYAVFIDLTQRRNNLSVHRISEKGGWLGFEQLERSLPTLRLLHFIAIRFIVRLHAWASSFPLTPLNSTQQHQYFLKFIFFIRLMQGSPA